MIYSLVHLIALVLPAQCSAGQPGVGLAVSGVGHWAAVTVIFTGGAFSHLRDCSLNCTQSQHLSVQTDDKTVPELSYLQSGLTSHWNKMSQLKDVNPSIHPYS